MKRLVVAALLAVFVGLGAPAVAGAQSVDVFEACRDSNAPSGVTNSTICREGTRGDGDSLPEAVTIIINTILLVLGMVAVIMIVVGGIRYTTSGGDAANVKRAKDTILYAVIGLVVAIMAFSIVNFVLDSF